MVRKFEGKDLVLASHNQGKIKEIRVLFSDFIDDLKSAADYNLDDPEETGSTFEANAMLKARYVALKTGKIAIADDSGLAVDHLGGDPGIFSARWAGEDRDFNYAIDRIKNELGETKNLKANFVCTLALAWPDGHVEVVRGEVHGNLTFPAKGDKGFGYDPIFVANGQEMTFGEMEASEKKKISHRADAFKKMMDKCFR